MKKILLIFAVIIILVCIFLFSSCKKEIDIKFVDDVVFARFDNGYSYMDYDTPISFAEFEKGSKSCPSRSSCYVKFLLTFNDTPKGYTASDLYDMDWVTVDGEKKYVRTRAGEKYNQIEIIIWMIYRAPYDSHTLESITYNNFDSVKGERIKNTFELNYDFECSKIPTWINPYSEETKMEAEVIELNSDIIKFKINTNIDYDKLIYNVTEKGKMQYASEYKALVSEETYDKADEYICKINADKYYYYIELEIVGYQKDGVNYYIYPIEINTYNVK